MVFVSDTDDPVLSVSAVYYDIWRYQSSKASDGL